MATGSVVAVGDGFLTTSRMGDRVKYTWDLSLKCRSCFDDILIMFFYDPDESESIELLAKHGQTERRAFASDWQFWQVFNVVGSVLVGCDWPWDTEIHQTLYDLRLP